MTQPAWSPSVTPLGASTLARKWLCDINTGTTAAPVWTRLRGVQEFSPSDDPETQDDSDYDSAGFKSEIQTALGWGAEVTVARKQDNSGTGTTAAYDPAQEFLRLRAYKMGLENIVEIRYYEWSGVNGPKVQAYQGRCSVQWEEQSGDMTELSSAKITLTGNGKRTDITHPGATYAGP